MRALATIRTVGNLESIPGADKIKLAHVDDWQCVIGANDFHPGKKQCFLRLTAH